MPKEGKKILEYIPGEKSFMTPFVIYADLKSILEKISGCENAPEKSLSTNINKHTLFNHCLFDKSKNKFDHYGGNNCYFYIDLREQAEK